jgi:hypothetical protein
VELHEFQVGDTGPGPVGHRHAVAGRHGWVRRLAEHMTGATGREQRGGRARRHGCSILLQELDTDATLVLDDQGHGPRVRVNPDVPDPGHTLPERPAEFATGGVTRVEHAALAVRRLEREGRLAVRSAVELRAPRDQLAHVARTLLDQHRDRAFVAEAVAGRDRVGKVLRRAVVGPDGGGDASLRVTRVARAWSGFRQHEDVAGAVERGGRAQRRDPAADDQKIGSWHHSRAGPH